MSCNYFDPSRMEDRELKRLLGAGLVEYFYGVGDYRYRLQPTVNGRYVEVTFVTNVSQRVEGRAWRLDNKNIRVLDETVDFLRHLHGGCQRVNFLYFDQPIPSEYLKPLLAQLLE